MGPGWSLNLTMQHRQRLKPRGLQQGVVPFLALAGLSLPRAVAARSQSLFTAIPWLTPRWLLWSRQTTAPGESVATETKHVQINTQQQTFLSSHVHLHAHTHAHTSAPAPGQSHLNGRSNLNLYANLNSNLNPNPNLNLNLNMNPDLKAYLNFHSLLPSFIEPSSRSLTALASSAESALFEPDSEEWPRTVPNLPAQDEGMTFSAFPGLALLLALRSQSAGKKMPSCIRGAEANPGHGLTVLQRASWPKSSAASSPEAGKYENPALDRIFPQYSFYQQRSFSPLGLGSRADQLFEQDDLSAVTVKDSLFAGTMPAAYPDPGRSETADIRTLLLTEPKLPSPVKNFSAFMPLQGMNLVMETIRNTAKREVETAIRQQQAELHATASDKAGGWEQSAAENPLSDKQARQLMRKMQQLAQEERFRLGLLR